MVEAAALALTVPLAVPLAVALGRAGSARGRSGQPRPWPGRTVDHWDSGALRGARCGGAWRGVAGRGALVQYCPLALPGLNSVRIQPAITFRINVCCVDNQYASYQRCIISTHFSSYYYCYARGPLAAPRSRGGALLQLCLRSPSSQTPWCTSVTRAGLIRVR